MSDYPDEDAEDQFPAVRPDFSHLSIGDMLTRLQRAHIENLLALAEGDELPKPQVLAQINRYLMDNGIVIGEVPRTIEGQAHHLPEQKVEALPNYEGENYDE